jgi:hypothetical protein
MRARLLPPHPQLLCLQFPPTRALPLPPQERRPFQPPLECHLPPLRTDAADLRKFDLSRRERSVREPLLL